MNCLECSIEAAAATRAYRIEAARTYLAKRAARPVETQLSLVF
jgi:hypothetical protein